MSVRVVHISLHDFNIISAVENYTLCIFEASWISEQRAAADRKSILEALTQLDDELPVLYHIIVDGRDDAEDFVIDKLLSTALPTVAILTCGGIVQHIEGLKRNGVFNKDSFELNFKRVRANLPRLLGPTMLSSGNSSSDNGSAVMSWKSNSLEKIISLLFDSLDDNERMKIDDENTAMRRSADRLLPLTGRSSEYPEALTLFLSGDKSSVGKSSTCLAILATLIRCGVPPSAIAYIKPVTQCEAGQPVTDYCTRAGIAHCGIGPVVFYKGFTRAYLKGETPSADALLKLAVEAVSKIGIGKRVVIVDGVGYPSVGSICNLSNAHIAQALGSPVLLIGKPGVGDAVDSFNINAKYFESYGVKVLGGIFNKLPLEGFYSLEACKEAVTSYFSQHGQQYCPYGFIPLLQSSGERGRMDIAESIVPDTNTVNVTVTATEVKPISPTVPPAVVLPSNPDASDEEALVDAFLEHVDLGRLLFDVFMHSILSREMILTNSNGFAPFVRPQHDRQVDYHIPSMAMVIQRNNNYNPYTSGMIDNSGIEIEYNGHGSDRSSRTYSRNYDRANSTENRYDRHQYYESEKTYVKNSSATSSSDGGSMRVSTGQRVEKGTSSSFTEPLSAIKRRRLEGSPHAIQPVQTLGPSPSNMPSQRTREEIEASAYSQGAKKGG